MMKRTLAVVLAAALAAPGCAMRPRPLMHVAYTPPPQQVASAAVTAEAWRSFFDKLAAGSRVKVTLKSGRSMRATFMHITDDVVVVNPRTRVPEPVQTIALADLAAVDVESQGTSLGTAIGIGIASGVGAFFTVLMIAIATIDD